MRDVGRSGEGVEKMLIDDGVTEKKVAILLLSPQTYKCEEVWLTIVRDDEMKYLLRAALLSHIDGLLKYSWASGYRNDAALLAVDSPASRKLSAVSAESSLEHYRKMRFLNDRF